ncbi:hypothetical protein [Streptomyces sp. NPDC090025]|uniref:hypothetical protein n=1 Tax=Streptomyces sp. NPDC090025 TaxID=3365922 RepID=UPI0038395C41
MALVRAWGRTLGRWAGREDAAVVKDSGDPEVARIREAAEAGDWPTVRAVLEARPEAADRTELLWAVGDTAGVEQWMPRVLEAEPDTALPRVVAGIRYITFAWEARTGALAEHVSRDQFRVFHARLRDAERWLYEAAEREPGWASPWYGLQITGRGLEVGQTVARRRFEAVVRRSPQHRGAHQQQLQQVCQKWGGSHEEMHAFARDSAFGAPGGTLLGGLVPDAHIEQWLMLDRGADTAYMRTPEVLESLRRAADHSYRHPGFRQETGWLNTVNSFALAFSLAADQGAARECFELLAGRVTKSPWQYLNADRPADVYRKMRSAAGR